MSGNPKRVLHVVRAMNRGGIETWLMNVLRRLDPSRVRLDFLVHTDRLCTFDAEIERCGSAILRCPTSWRSPGYGARIRSILENAGPYDVVHSHVHHFSGFLLRVASRVGAPVRIAHSHSDTSRVDDNSGWMRRGYLSLSRRWIGSYATHLVAASRMAGQALFGRGWDSDGRGSVLRCGIDLAPFREGNCRAEVRAEWQIGARETVIGHVGRFDTPKNHLFLVDAVAEAARHMPGLRLLMVGDGPTRRGVEKRIESLGLGRIAILTGERSDVPRLLQAMDVFVFPSVWEGLPLTVVEAQAAAVPCVISDAISVETDIVPGLIRREPLSLGPRHWAEAALSAARGWQVEPAAALEAVAGSDFDIARSVEGLYALYNA